MIVNAALAAAASMLVVWVAFLFVLLVAKPEGGSLRDSARCIPDVVRLIRRLVADKTLSRGVRVRLWLLVFYLASPIDLVPDFIPVIGYADDAIIVSLVLRGIVKRAGVDAVRRHWPGTAEGLNAVARLCRLPQLANALNQSARGET